MNKNEEKKRYLQQYREAKKKVRRISEQISELRSQKMFPAAVGDGMPKGNGHSDFSGYVAKLDTLIRQLEQEREQAVKQYAEIYMQIHKVQDETEREVLIRRYLLGEAWERIAVNMDYDYRYVLKIHGKALKKFEISERGH